MKKFLLLCLFLVIAFSQIFGQSENFSQKDLQVPNFYQSVNVIDGQFVDSDVDLVLNGPSPIEIKRFPVSPGILNDTLASGWAILPFDLCKNELEKPKENLFPSYKVAYEYDAKGNLQGIINKSLDESITFSSLKVVTNTPSKFELVSSSSQRLIYEFKTENGSKLLTKVKVTGRPEISYTYEFNPFSQGKLISSRSEQGQTQKIEYHWFSEHSAGKVKSISERDVEGKWVTSARFNYREGETEVYDALNRKTLYRYSKDKKLTSIESQNPDGSKGVYRIIRFYWDKDRIISKTLEGAEGVVQCETFLYDDKGRLVKETLWGNISGKTVNGFSVDAQGQPSGSVESYTKSYTLSDDGLILEASEDNGKSIKFTYDPKTKLLKSQLSLYQGKIVKREFYDFDSKGILQKTIVDDGVSEAPQDLSQVTERRVTEILSYAPAPNVSVPQEIEERYVDIETGSEHVLKRMINTYSKEGWLLTQQAYDSDGILRQSIENTYDAAGNLLSKKDLDGKDTQYDYDLKNNPSRRSSFDDKSDTHFYYDNHNQLIREDELSEDGTLKSIHHTYDVLGNKITSTDSSGNTTTYSYDSLNRLTSTLLPLVPDAEGNTTQFQVQNEYDVFDRIVKTLEPDNAVTETIYNVHGNPTEKKYPNGSIEKWVYNLDGTLKQAQDKKGFVSTYTYDTYGNPTVVTISAPDGETLQTIKSTYTAFRIVSTHDSNGSSVLYKHDGAGRVILETQGNSKIAYEYDSMGQCRVKKEWYGPNEEDYRATVTERGVDNEITRVYIQDSFGHVLICRDASEEQTSNFKEVESRIVNELGQHVVKITQIDNQGVATEIIYDALNRIESLIKKDPFGQKLSQVVYRYDFAGNTCKEIYTVIAAGQEEKNYIISKLWNSQKQLLQVTEGEGSPKQKTTRYSYNDKGQLQEILKPDGRSITQKYNAQGQLIELAASDRSFYYRYTYDSTGNIAAAEDLISGTVTRRGYDEKHQLLTETLASGLKSSWTYDDLGRLTSAVLPDNTSTTYSYNAANLVEIQRNLKDKTLAHRYTYDDIRGRVLNAKMMGSTGTIQFDYDAMGRPQGIDSPYWSQTLGSEGRDNVGRIIRTKIVDPRGVQKIGYEYDFLSRLVGERGGAADSKYTYDSIDNRLTKNEHAVSLDSLNQILSHDQQKFSYDANGNIIAIKQFGQAEKRLTYDPFNRLTKVQVGQETWEYTYDPFNRRISKQHGNEVENYLYYGDLEIGSANKEGKIQQLRTLGIGVSAEAGAAVLMELDGREYVPIHDLQGSVRALVDIETHTVSEFYQYSAFGELTVCSRTEDLDFSAINNPWFFSGKRLDQETGLYFFGKRYYAPDLGRWLTPDPLGFADGPNLYSYVHQNPLNLNDLYGLFSFSALWNSVKAFFTKCFEKIKAFFQMIGSWCKKYLSGEAIKDYFKFIGYEIVAKGFAILKGKFKYRSVQGVYGNGELNEKVRVTFVNGIYTEPHHLTDNIIGISESHGGVNVHYIYSASRGLFLDLIRAAKIKFGFTSPEAHLLADTWRQMIAEMGGTEGNGTIVHYAHSIGAGDTERALALMTQDERKMIKVTTFGSPILMDGDYGGSQVVNYVNVRDGVSMLDPLKYFRALFSGDRSIIFVGSMNGFPFIDHLFGCQVYRQVYETLGKYFVQLYGS